MPCRSRCHSARISPSSSPSLEASGPSGLSTHHLQDDSGDERRVRIGLLLEQIHDRDILPFAGVDHGDGAADARIAAGDQCQLAFQLAGGLVVFNEVARTPSQLGFEAGRLLVLFRKRWRDLGLHLRLGFAHRFLDCCRRVSRPTDRTLAASRGRVLTLAYWPNEKLTRVPAIFAVATRRSQGCCLLGRGSQWVGNGYTGATPMPTKIATLGRIETDSARV